MLTYEEKNKGVEVCYFTLHRRFRHITHFKSTCVVVHKTHQFLTHFIKDCHHLDLSTYFLIICDYLGFNKVIN